MNHGFTKTNCHTENKISRPFLTKYLTNRMVACKAERKFLEICSKTKLDS